MQTALPSGRSPLASYAPASPIPDTSHSRSATTPLFRHPPTSSSSANYLLIYLYVHGVPREIYGTGRRAGRYLFRSTLTASSTLLAAVVLLYESCCIARGEKSRSRGCNNFEGWKRYNFASDDLLGLYHLYKIWSRLSLIEEWIWFDRFVNQIANCRESNRCEIFIVYFVFC